MASGLNPPLRGEFLLGWVFQPHPNNPIICLVQHIQKVSSARSHPQLSIIN